MAEVISLTKERKKRSSRNSEQLKIRLEEQRRRNEREMIEIAKREVKEMDW